ncbi:MAG: hypothetical protein HPY44_19465 [Armatimonadetes bacterium]|nr:hypothetical protein [Armatimonadota bacterium]
MKSALALALLVVACVLSGCGGGGDEVAGSSSGTAMIVGTVTAPGVATSAAPENPAAYCQVTVENAQTRTRLGSGQADGVGQYSIGPIRSGQTIMVRATLRDGTQLKTRAQVRGGNCRADVDQDSTIAAAVVESLQDAGVTDEDLQGAAYDVCAQYQARTRYHYRTAGNIPPDFTNPDEVDQTAGELLEAATQAAIATAVATRTPGDCDNAVAMVEARLRAGDATATGWGAEVRRRLSVAMQNGRKFTAEEVAEAATAAVLGTVQSAGGDLVRNQFEQRIRHHYAGTMEGPEALEVLCASEGTPDQVRLKTQQQVRDCVNVLLAG